jgi:hypothetical protein
MTQGRVVSYLAASFAILTVFLGQAAADAEAGLEELRARVESQGKQIAETAQKIAALREQLDRSDAQRASPQPPAASRPNPDAVKKVVSDYLKDNPGAGMPPGVQTGFFSGQGFVIRSAPDPAYAAWDDESKIPFELRIRGRLQAGYYGYKATDDANHQTGAHQQAQDANTHRFADFSQLEVKRMMLMFEGTAFDPDLHYRVILFSNTRGIGGFQNNKVIQTAGAFDPNTAPASPVGGGVTLDHGVTLQEGYVFYDFHGCACSRGCGPDCPRRLLPLLPDIYAGGRQAEAVLRAGGVPGPVQPATR